MYSGAGTQGERVRRSEKFRAQLSELQKVLSVGTRLR